MKNFLTITEQRSGSGLLASLCSQHPAILHGGEFLRGLPRHKEGGVHIKDILKGDFSGITKFYNTHDEEIKYVGFKAHGKQLQDSYVNALKGMTDLKIIFLERQNLLKRYLSMQYLNLYGFSRKTKIPSNISFPYPPLVLSATDMVKNFEKVTKRNRKLHAEFDSHESVRIFYEDLNRDKQREMSRIFDFFDVDFINIEEKIEKMETRKLSEAISNYKDLKKVFCNTEWENFFED
tara:strand:+ start:892 stop:1596 length:705 start_codon:yes stop_codon:yes gene_type:complete